MKVGAAWLLVLVAACKGAPSAPPATPEAPALDDKADELPPPARVVDAKELAGGELRCGPWSTKDLASADMPMLDDRMRVRFFAGATPVGGSDSGKLEVRSGADALFIGARETFQRGDELFERRAAKAATFGGDYEALTLPDRDGKAVIVTGVRKAVSQPKEEMIALAHGWFLDAQRNVLDVAVFATAGSLTDFAACRVFAQRLVSTAIVGPRALAVGAPGPQSVKVSYATFTFQLPPEWVMTSSMGIHDFARIHFRKRGVFPREYTDLSVALDSHPGDWTSDGEPDGERKGNLLGLPVAWHLTKTPSPGASWGGWTQSATLAGYDHAVASILASSAAGRDEALRFAESIKR